MLVTGSHRSGTSWVGRMIAASRAPRVAYLWEPFSLVARPGICAAPFVDWFTYVCAENEDRFLPGIRDMLAYRYAWRAELRETRSPKDLARLSRDAARFRTYRRQRARPLLKDPIAVFSSAWIADRFDASVVVLIRHPAAFTNSIVRRELRHPFQHFVNQPLLMADVLAPFEDDVRRFAEREQPLLEQGILLWNLIHHAIAELRSKRPEWLFLRLEDIADAPLDRFQEIFDHVDIPFDERIHAKVVEHSDASNPAMAERMDSTKRDSRAAVRAWRRHLSDADVARIREGVEPVSSAFYSDDDW
jgi:hypothetical protein